MGCCEDHPGPGVQAANPGGNALQTQESFQEFMKAAAAPGALDARTKRAVAIALSVLARCEPCLKTHIKKAREMGFSQEEIDEAGWLAVSFGGCAAMMFFNGLRQTA
jgi:AhpD family alkylhydroperoxidase